MKIITQNDILDLHISANTCIQWVRESFSIKKQSQLPAKISVHPQGYDYYTAMPCLLPASYDRVGLKMVHRVKGAVPSVGSDLLLYKASTGELLAMMDGSWITAMRTGAVAALATLYLRSREDAVYSFIGLGNTARATLLCLLESEPERIHKVILKKYKNQEQNFIERFAGYSNVTFSFSDDNESLVAESDVIFSCITDADGLICENMDSFKSGCTLIPIHVRGFENCDTYFDKVFGDDTEPLKNWRHFGEFKYYGELQDVLSGSDGRTGANERILSYNYGLGLHDALFATKIYDMLSNSEKDVSFEKLQAKFWV